MMPPVEGPGDELDEVVRGFHTHPGLWATLDLALVHEVLGPTDWERREPSHTGGHGRDSEGAPVPQRHGP